MIKVEQNQLVYRIYIEIQIRDTIDKIYMIICKQC